MNDFYQKLKDMPEDRFLLLQTILGIAGGVLCWVALRLGYFADDKLVTYIPLIVCAVIIIGARSISRKIERSANRFNLCMAISLGACILIFAIFAFLLPAKKGLLELIFHLEAL